MCVCVLVPYTVFANGINTQSTDNTFFLRLFCCLDSIFQNDLKGSFTAQHKEQQLKKKLEQLKAKSPQNRQQIVSFNCNVFLIGKYEEFL